VLYAQDVEFSDVFFVDAETGWACGRRTGAVDGGFIVGTRDGGRTWSVQYGGPESPTPGFARMFFVDAAHGWATQADGTMLRTTNGLTWAAAGDVRALGPFVFVSPDKGFLLDREQNILATADGGRTWNPAYRCRVIIGVTGVSHEQDCDPEAIAFAPDKVVGYVITRAIENRVAAVIKTLDGGSTWTMASLISDVDGRGASLAFVDPLIGYLRAGRALTMTADGGQTWHHVEAFVPDGAPKIVFAGAVGWMVAGNDFSYTLDGAKRWNTRKVDFPTGVVSFSVPSPDTGYVVGSHGMVYRYRVVPFDYMAPRIIPVPAMTPLRLTPEATDGVPEHAAPVSGSARVVRIPSGQESAANR
jgi:photosystem II stability/assembly factor-like uncharacterized protein